MHSVKQVSIICCILIRFHFFSDKKRFEGYQGGPAAGCVLVELLRGVGNQ